MANQSVLEKQVSIRPTTKLRLGQVLVVASILTLSVCASPASAFSRRIVARASSPAGQCKVTMNLKAFKQLNQICDDCVSLYKQPEIYQLCR